MAKHSLAVLLATMTSLASAPAMAYPENPFFTPEHPTANDAIIVNASAGPCDLLQYPFAAPEVTVSGDRITVQLSGEHYADAIFCNLGSRVDQAAIGPVPAGSYTVTINWSFQASSGTVTVPLGTLPLTVVNAPGEAPAPLPASSSSTLISLAFALMAVATTKLRARARPRVVR